jgi:pimeloyl-ACP methyl ester carboxylesterase
VPVFVLAAAVTSALAANSPSGASFTLGSLRFEACNVGAVRLSSSVSAWCTQFEVPEDWSAPSGRQIQLRVAIVPSTLANSTKDLLVFLDGGPGGAATDDYPAIAPALTAMRRRHHVLLIDQRGTGGSNELTCKDDKQVIPADGKAGNRELNADQERREAAQRVAIDRNKFEKEALQRELRDCLKQLSGRADPAQYTTGNAVRDLEAVRQALGAPQLNLLGVSYGTRMAQQYATAYPTAVRSVILDSVVPNELALGGETAINLDDALKAQFDVCRRNAACAKRFVDPYASLYRLRDRLRTQSVKSGLRDPVSFAPLESVASVSDLAMTARLFAYAPTMAALLPLTIDEALQGRYEPLLGQRKLITDSLSDQLTAGMSLSVSCAEDADLLQAREVDTKLLLGTTMIQYLQAACEVWPRGPRAARFHQPWKSDIPTLVLAGQYDPITPVRYGETVVKNLTNARLLQFKGQGHGVIGVGCMPRLAGEFLDGLKPAALDAKCLASLGDTPAFLDYSGPAP